jgi:hypothetical protein
MLPSSLLDLIHNPVFQALVLIPLGLILLDLVTGIMSAASRGQFDIQHLPDFLSKDILKYAGSWFLVLLSWIFLGNAMASTLTATLGMSVLSLSVLNSSWDNLHEVFSKDPEVMLAIDAVAGTVGLQDPGRTAIPDVPGPLPVVQSPAIPVEMTSVPQPLPVDQWNTGQIPVPEPPK